MTWKPKYNFHEMKVGDSFEIDESEGLKARTAASKYGLRNDKKFSAIKHGPIYKVTREA